MENLQKKDKRKIVVENVQFPCCVWLCFECVNPWRLCLCESVEIMLVCMFCTCLVAAVRTEQYNNEGMLASEHSVLDVSNEFLAASGAPTFLC